MMIVGAGLSGLIAAHVWQDADVCEVMPRPKEVHKALLRFRTPEVSALVGIPFRQVHVRKAIWDWDNSCYMKPTIALANAYSVKVIGRVTGDRSIWNLETVERFIAPEDFYAQMIERVHPRIFWGQAFPFDQAKPDRPTVMTVPLPLILKEKQVRHDLEFVAAPINVRRYRISNCDVFQTVYVPSPNTGVYRMSITGSLLIVESMQGIGQSEDDEDLDHEIRTAFGLHGVRIVPLETSAQARGKIAAVDELERRSLLSHLSQQHGIYTLGRFATWRNLLLDDLPKDIAAIRRLMAHDRYSARIAAVG